MVIQKLKEKNPADYIVGLVRSLEKASALGLGIQTRMADFDKPEPLESALTGVETLLLISGSEMGKRAAQHANIIEAAKKKCGSESATGLFFPESALFDSCRLMVSCLERMKYQTVVTSAIC